MIPQETVQKVIDTADIVEVVGEFVSLHKAGTNYKGLCPFHNEKTPSFVVSPAKQIFKCFGCGASGTPVSFLMKHEQLSFPEAIKWLAKKYNIEIQEKELSTEELAILKENETINVLNTFAQKHFTHNLLQTEEGKTIALPYFESRGFSEETIKKFQLGYSLNKRDDLVETAIKKGYKAELLVKAGLAGEKGSNNVFSGKTKYYDRFRNRVIFPIHSLSGKVIAFGGRILGKNKDMAKYVNSPETAIYHKSKSLYGIYFAKNEIVRQDKCFLVEGYTDVISMHQAGITNLVASSGTSLTEEQIHLIHRFTENITLIFDGDNAGIKAGIRGLDMVLKEDMNVRIVALPQGEDPDSFSKKMHGSEIKEYIENNETDFIIFKIGLLKETDLADPIKKTKAVQNILKTISVIPDEIKRISYIKETSRLLDYKEEIIYAEINKLLGKEAKKQATDEKRRQAKERRQTPEIPKYISEKSLPEEKELLKFLLKFGEKEFDTDEEQNKISVAQHIISEVESEGGFQYTVNQDIFKIYKKKLDNNEIVDISLFLNHENDDIRELSTKIISEEHILSKFWENNGSTVPTPEETYKKDIEICIIDFKISVINQFLHNKSEELKNPNLSFDEQKIIFQNSINAQTLRRELLELRGGKNIYKI